MALGNVLLRHTWGLDGALSLTHSLHSLTHALTHSHSLSLTLSLSLLPSLYTHTHKISLSLSHSLSHPVDAPAGLQAPLPNYWIESQRDLQVKIMQRLRELEIHGALDLGLILTDL